jgi:hypothetical protein
MMDKKMLYLVLVFACITNKKIHQDLVNWDMKF